MEFNDPFAATANVGRTKERTSMKFKTLVFSVALLLFFLTSSQAFGANLKKWEASCDIDKFTDEKSCRTFVYTTNDDIIYRIYFMVFHSQKKGKDYGLFFYVHPFYGTSKSNYCHNSNVIRIDKNDAIYFNNYIIIEDMANQVLEQMLTGKTVAAKCGDDDFTFPLNGFSEGYEFVKKNMAFDPLKNNH